MSVKQTLARMPFPEQITDTRRDFLKACEADCAIEFTHATTILHDDVVDKFLQHRDQHTANAL